MKRTFTFVITCLMAFSMMGQTNVSSLKIQKAIEKGKAIKALQKKNNKRFGLNLSNQQQSSSSKFKSANIAKQKLDSIVYIDTMDTKWLPSEKSAYTYDSNNNVISQMDYYYDGSSDDSIKFSITYNSKNQMDTSKLFYFDTDEKAWLTLDKTAYTFDANGNQILEEDFEFDTDAWVPTSKYTYEYTSAGKLTKEVDFNYDADNSVWVNYEKYSFKYSTNGNMLSDSSYKWNEAKEVWNATSKDDYIYDSFGNITIDSCSILDVNKGQWVTDSKTTFKYNTSVPISNLIMPCWWTYSSSGIEFKYQMTGFVTIDYKNSTWVGDEICTWYYSTQSENGTDTTVIISNPTGVDLTSEAKVNIFPNPASEYITVNLNGNTQTSLFEMFDVVGHNVLSSPISGSNQISIESLTKGIYFWKINLNGKSFNGKLLVK